MFIIFHLLGHLSQEQGGSAHLPDGRGDQTDRRGGAAIRLPAQRPKFSCYQLLYRPAGVGLQTKHGQEYSLCERSAVSGLYPEEDWSAGQFAFAPLRDEGYQGVRWGVSQANLERQVQ